MVTDNFSDKAIEEAFSIKLNSEFLKKRPKVYGFTIDGRYSKDLDDGISLTRDGENYLLQVSIADVAEYITPGMGLYQSAIENVETHYFNSYNEPMLPRILSETRLSLWPDIWKPAITFDIHLSQELEVIDFSFKETVFKSVKKYNYEEYDELLKQKDTKSIFNNTSQIADIGMSLLNKRRVKGALAIYDIKRGVYTNEEGILKALDSGMAHVANIIVQEAMIITNTQTALFFAKHDLPFLYRNHTAKQSAPGRGEILEQMNFALNKTEYIESLQGRANVWFNRALYEPTLKGHYGLNESAYTHVTSPIRRVADLINHQQIKAYLRSEQAAFTHSELIEISQGINIRKAEYDEQRSAMFKEKSLVLAMQNFAKNSEEHLQSMTTAQFAQVVKAAAINREMNEALKAEIYSRFAQGAADADMLYKILFLASANSEEWKEVVAVANAFMYHTKGMPLQILQIHNQKGFIEEFEFEVKPTRKGFSARLSGNLMDEETYCTDYYFAESKKDAMQESAFYFLQPLLDVQFNKDAEKVYEEIKSSFVEVVKMPTENYVGKVQDFCMQNRSCKWGEPDYNFQMSGPAHSPIVTSEVKLNSPYGTLTEQAVAANKKNAKNIVAEKLYIRIREVLHGVADNAEPESNPEISIEQLPKVNDENANFIGLLQEYLQKNKKPIPQYEYSQSGEQHEPVFNCTITIAFTDAPLELSVQGKNKSIAKHNAAKAAYDWLRENG